MMNVGLETARAVYRERGLAAKIIPSGPNAKATLANLGQMQAIAHDVSAMIGVYMDVGSRSSSPWCGETLQRLPVPGDGAFRG